MTITEMNRKLQTVQVKACPWTDAFSNQCLLTVKSVAGNRTVTFAWEGEEEGSQIEKTSQVSYSTWNYIVESLKK